MFFLLSSSKKSLNKPIVSSSCLEEVEIKQLIHLMRTFNESFNSEQSKVVAPFGFPSLDLVV